MKFKSLRIIIFLSFLCVFPASRAQTQLWQSPADNDSMGYAQIDKGIELYGDGRWGEAIVQLRRVQQENIRASARAEAQFWIAMSAFAAEQYQESIYYFDEIARIDPGNIRCAEAPYHKGRANYYLKRYEDALKLFDAYAASIRVDGRYINDIRVNGWNGDAAYNGLEGDYNRKSAAIYWMGECYYSLENMSRSEELFNIVVKDYPKSHKFEPATNRLAMIKQKKIEAELLDILKTVPSESQQAAGSASQNQQQQTSDEAILEYQKRIAPYLITEAYNERVKGGTAGVSSAALPENPPPASAKTQSKDTDAIMRLLAIKTTALEIMDRLVTAMNTHEIIEEVRW
jgi:TolA-binding protein